MTLIEIMIAGDDNMFREGLKQLFENDANIHIMAEAENTVKCLDLLHELYPDILIINIDMMDGAGFDFLRELELNCKKDIKIIILTGHSDVEYLMKVMLYKVHGYVLLSSNFRELRNAVYAVMNGEVYIQSKMKCKMDFFDVNDSSVKSDVDRINSLTVREMDVLKLLSVGMYNKEIALKLDISERTVKNHISNIFKKIGVSDRTQAAVFAIRNYLVDIYNR